jgi:hypothetical protein
MGLVFLCSSFTAFCSSFVRVGGFEGGLGRGGAAAVLLGDFKAFGVWICLDFDRKNHLSFSLMFDL